MKLFKAILFTFLVSNFLIINVGQSQFSLETFATGLSQPIGIANAGDGRLFVIERKGVIQVVFADGSKASSPYLDIQNIVNDNQSERGLLGLAFHPNYQENGYFYVNYTNNSGNTIIARYSSSMDLSEGLASTRKELLMIEQPFWNHNGGDLHFGPDGYLYISTGDGGSGGDPFKYSQNRLSLLGKLLRIDVDNGDPYAIPESNPFAMDDGTLDEIWALGLRNPWRISFDRETGNLWIGDVGQDSWEEVDFQPADSPGGENYGWNCREGFHAFSNNCDQSSPVLVDPVWEFQNSNAQGQGCSITGGYVYRGAQQPSLFGKYIYTDFCSGRFWSLEQDFELNWENAELLNGSNNSFTAFGEDVNGELFVCDVNGSIKRVVFDCASPDFTFESISSCAGAENGQIILNTSLANAEFSWDNGSMGDTLKNVGPGIYTVTITNEGCIFVRTFNVGEMSVDVPMVDDLTFCPNDMAQVFANAPSGYSQNWFFENELISTEAELTVVESGTYGLQYVGDCDSEIEEFEVTILDEAQIEIIVSGVELNATDGFATYQWFLNGSEILDANTASFTAVENGMYTVEVTDQNGCFFVSDAVEVTMVSSMDLSKLALNVKPNPFKEFILVESERSSLLYQIVNISGKTIQKGVLASRSSKLDVSMLDPGLYLLHVNSADASTLIKLIKH